MKAIVILLIAFAMTTGCAKPAIKHIGSKDSKRDQIKQKVLKITENENCTEEGCIKSEKEKSAEKITNLIIDEKRITAKKVIEKQSLYKKAQNDTIIKMLNSPVTPIKTPDKILRVLMLPWVDESGVLNAQGYKFVKVEEGSWVLGEYLSKSGSAIKLLSPLKKEIK